MKIPSTINENTRKTYYNRPFGEGSINILQSENFEEWDEGIPKLLQELCIETIAKNWAENPILEDIILPIDRWLLLESLPTELPLKLTVPRVKDDIYWKRCFLERWPKARPFNAPELQISQIVRNGNNSSRVSSVIDMSCTRPTRKMKQTKTWKEYFLEMFMRTYLEKLKPEDYNAEKMKELSDLCQSYVKTLILRELQSAADSSNHIPLHSVLGGFHNLTELSICFKQTYIGDKFDWTIVEIPFQDIRQFSKGLEKCKLLKILRIQNSNIDNDNVTVILQSLLQHEFLKVLDFSHCQISDKGARTLGKFCTLSSTLEDLILVNNKIRLRGVEALCYVLHQEATTLRRLDLKLNSIRLEGGNKMIACLKTGSKLRSLSLSGCGLIGDESNLLGEMLESNCCLEDLDVSNNKLGENLGHQILNGLQYNTTIRTLDIRMCGLGSRTEFEIQQKMSAIREASKIKPRRQKPRIIEPPSEYQISDDLITEIEEILNPLYSSLEPNETIDEEIEELNPMILMENEEAELNDIKP